MPAYVRRAAAGQRILALPTPVVEPGRLRRATRACLLGVAAVSAALAHGHMGPEDVAGARTALVFASASAYAAANWTFLTGGTENALHFPYTAPSAVPGEVSIHYGLTGPYLTLLSGANAGIEALWQAVTLLQTGQCDRAIVLGVETFQECAALYAAGRWLLGTPLSEVAGCLILAWHPGLAEVRYRAARGASALRELLQAEQHTRPGAVYLSTATARAGQEAAAVIRAQWPEVPLRLLHEYYGFCLACAPLMAVTGAMSDQVPGDGLYVSHWWEDWSMLRWPGMLVSGSL
ncbi:MAG: beta-ketoacyl synthase N-terminal-like domain-containing protein [Candidatus Tectimicrobiota bacterium]